MIRTGTPEFIVERQLYAVDRTGKKTRFSIRIGKPYAELDGERWACRVWPDGLDDRQPDMRGMDSLQAVTLALAFARSIGPDAVSRSFTWPEISLRGITQPLIGSNFEGQLLALDVAIRST